MFKKILNYYYYRERVGGKTSADHEHSKNVNKHRFGDIDRNKKDR